MSSRNVDLNPILLRISIEKLEPLTGSATLDNGERVWFEGWLGLLSVLSELVNSCGRRATSKPTHDDKR